MNIHPQGFVGNKPFTNNYYEGCGQLSRRVYSDDHLLLDSTTRDAVLFPSPANYSIPYSNMFVSRIVNDVKYHGKYYYIKLLNMILTYDAALATEPYFILTISCTSETNNNIITTNNINVKNATFIVPTTDKTVGSFLQLNSKMVQFLPFRLDDDLSVRITNRAGTVITWVGGTPQTFILLKLWEKWEKIESGD